MQNNSLGSSLEMPSMHSEGAMDQLAVLDHEQEWTAFSKLLQPDAGIWQSTVIIDGMHCAACSFTIEDALLKVPGVTGARVNAASHRAVIDWSAESVLPSVWMRSVQDVGYQVAPANDVFSLERRKLETRQALWRWLVAGLCMMQVMMYAYPAYIAHPGDLSLEMEHLLRWASWVLSLPVVLFSCGPFFRNALRDIRIGQISMDLPVALGIFITFAVSTAGTFEPTGTFGKEVYFDSLTMFVFFLLTGRWLELRMRDRTAGALEALMNRLPDRVERRMPDGSFELIVARRVQVGDVLRVQAGQAFAADGEIETGQALVDESLLTGESTPVLRGTGESVIAGSHNLSATVLIRVTQTGSETRFAQIVALMESASASKPKIAQLADRLAKPFLIGVLLSAAFACAWWWRTDPEHALMVAVAVLVVTCPCALSLATPTAMLTGAGRLARAGILVRNLAALEALSKVDTVVFDKTGTLTTDAMSIVEISARDGIDPSSALALAAALAQHSQHPISRALVTSASSLEAYVTSQYTCDAVVDFAGQGLEGSVQPFGVIRLGSAGFCTVDSRESQHIQVHLTDNAGWLASFSIQEDLRPSAVQTIKFLAELGVKAQILSGDRDESVRRVASQVGILESQGNCTPDEKLKRMQTLQDSGHVVAMVGDGLNDGPVLAGANVSFAFGQAVALTQSRSDLVILGADLACVAYALQLSRRTMDIVRQNLWWALLYNAACVPLALMGYLPAWLAGLGMATSSLFVVLNALRLALPASVRLTPQ